MSWALHGLHAQKARSKQVRWSSDDILDDPLCACRLLRMKTEQQEGKNQPSSKQPPLLLSCPGCNAIVASGSKVCPCTLSAPSKNALLTALNVSKYS